jgi:hypothetical protein
MKAIFIHLSDLHLRPTENSAEPKFSAVVSAVQNEETSLDAAVVIVSGDVADKGAKEEYAAARALLEPLVLQLADRLKLPVRVVIVPGNHDCYLPEEDSVRQAVIATIRKGESADVDARMIDCCVEAQQNFVGFRDTFPNAKPDLTRGPLYWEYRVAVKSASLLVRCYNTAWQSTRKEQQGALHFPANTLRDATSAAPADYCVSVFHHPYNWMPAQTFRAFRAHIEESSDLILTGHEHEPDHYQKYSVSGEVNEYLEGAVFQEHGQPHRSGFHAIVVDLQTQQQRSVSFRWEKDLFVPTDRKDWTGYSRGTRAGRNKFELTPEFEGFLEDPGASFAHPAKPELVLSDIYVLPNVKEFKLNRQSEFIYGSLIEGRDLLKVLGARKHSLIFGRQQSGKSTLTKVLFRDLFNKGLTPVLIHGDDIGVEHLTKEKFDALVERQFSRQFNNPMLPAFQQLDRDKTVIFIDDFDHVHLNAKGRLRLLEYLIGRYDKLYIFGDDVLKLEELAVGKDGAAVFPSFEQFEIVQFGHLLRNKLIEKWYSIGTEYVGDIEQVAKRVTEVERVITTLLGKNYLPSYPIYVLSFIQAMESSTFSRTSAGTYGSLYEILITQTLAVRSPSFSLDLKATYLSELAFQLFSTRARRFSEMDWVKFHNEYCAKYKISPGREELKRELARASMITLFDEKYGFQHPAAYYYFVARYLRDNITRPETRALITELCSKLNREEYASILLFLTHLSKDPFIIEVMLAHGKSLFQEFPPAKFETDIAFLSNFTDQIQNVVLEDGTYQQQKEKRLRELDEAPTLDDDMPDLVDETDEALKMIAQMTMALRTLEVLGQLIKNFPGSLVGTDKYQLVKECYELGLRTVSMLFSLFDSKVDDFVDLVADRIIESRKPIKDSEEFRKRMKSFLFWLIEATCFGMIKRISLAVGHPQLSETYAEVNRDMDSNASALVDIAINLEHLGFPEDQLQELSKRFPCDSFCGRVLRQLVVEHFYLFPTKESTKQKVCTAMEIPIQNLRQIDSESTHRRQVPTAGHTSVARIPDRASNAEGARPA